MSITIDITRLMARLDRLGQIGALSGGGVKRLALSPEDAEGRALVIRWMRELGLEITTDVIGNCWGIRAGEEDGPPVVMGSHIDTVATGGLYDGSLGVLAGLEVIEALNVAGARTRRPVAVAFFTNEEGARFAPDMMGSGVAQGVLPLDEMLEVEGIDGVRLRDALAAIDAAGPAPVGALKPHSYLELHIEQGPVLETEELEIGDVTGVQGISWTEITVTGASAHAGTTPMALRHDAGAVMARIAVEAQQIAADHGPPQVATVGRMRVSPDLVNVVPQEAVMTVDLRHTDEATLQKAETRLWRAAQEFARAGGCAITRRTLARFEPVEFDPALVDRVAAAAEAGGLRHRRMPSGAGHDAQMFAPNCPSAMIFVPSKDGISHNIHEYTAPSDIAGGAQVLMDVVCQQAELQDAPEFQTIETGQLP